MKIYFGKFFGALTFLITKKRAARGGIATFTSQHSAQSAVATRFSQCIFMFLAFGVVLCFELLLAQTERDSRVCQHCSDARVVQGE